MQFKKMTAIDLFCGAGGLTVGLTEGGFEVIAGVEFSPVAAESYKLNHKKHVLYERDICTLDPYVVMKDLNIQPGELDLLAGCPPCQGFSSHRTRNKASSVADDRNDLVFEFMKFVVAMKPKTIMMENVPGLSKDERIEKVKLELAGLGYFVNDKTVQVKDAALYGVPQRRKRMILKASLLGYIDEPVKVEEFSTVWEAIGGLPPPGDSGDYLHDFPVVRTGKVNELIRLIPKNGGSRKDLPIEYWLPCHVKKPNCYNDVYGRMAWEAVSPTITGGCISPSKGRFLHPVQDRAITLREAALLQTFPRGYKFSMARGRYSVALMIGNALPPEFIRRHAVEFKKHLISFI
ncbi:DNA cytosine methyltransferase [Pseudomonas cichorii]|uniref:DNA cytosine methyltransferase n=1 Tax=Pseudomonas cichorii TaxID=36746 RepID=UPI0018E66195|nr:DNA cytosine methyltransferase [Pseudomonas cichorii]MBI6853825.1 DNA cytosine methyltransferase [Pseudomonas cichorii]